MTPCACLHLKGQLHVNIQYNEQLLSVLTNVFELDRGLF